MCYDPVSEIKEANGDLPGPARERGEDLPADASEIAHVLHDDETARFLNGRLNGGKAVPTASPKGFMAKIAEMLNCSYMFENIMEMPEDLAGMLPDYMSYGIRDKKEAQAWAGRWSLSAYRDNLRNRQGENTKAEPALDELEKSIVAHLADEVTIGIHGHRIRLVISKNIRQSV